MPLFKDNFISYDTNIITQIPKGDKDEEDMVLSVTNMNGTYSIKSGYRLFHDQENRSKPNTFEYKK